MDSVETFHYFRRHLISESPFNKLTISNLLGEIEEHRNEDVEVAGRWSEKKLSLVEQEALKYRKNQLLRNIEQYAGEND